MVSICLEKAQTTRYTQTGKKVVPVKRHKQFDRITANELCKQAGLDPKYLYSKQIDHLLHQFMSVPWKRVFLMEEGVFI